MYINVKKCIIYYYIWALTYAVLAFGFLFVSSGRQVVEKKLAERGDPVAEKEKSTSWKIGVFFYSLTISFVFTANLLYFALINMDLNYQVENDFDQGKWGWRNVFVWIGHLLPLTSLTIDFALNRVVLSHKHLVFSLLFTLVYFFMTYIGQLIQSGKAIYIAHLNWFAPPWTATTCITYVSNNTANSDWVYVDLCPQPDWNANGLTLGLILGGNVVFHTIFVLFSELKSKKYFKKDS